MKFSNYAFDVFNTDRPRKFINGGRACSKTWTICQDIVRKLSTEDNYLAFGITSRGTAGGLFKTVCAVIDTLNLQDEFIVHSNVLEHKKTHASFMATDRNCLDRTGIHSPCMWAIDKNRGGKIGFFFEDASNYYSSDISDIDDLIALYDADAWFSANLIATNEGFDYCALYKHYEGNDNVYFKNVSYLDTLPVWSKALEQSRKEFFLREPENYAAVWLGVPTYKGDIDEQT